MKLAIVLGTRPEIIKMAPIINACKKLDVDFFILHTGQHYSENMDSVFFSDLELPEPDYNLGVGNQPHRKQVGLMTRHMIEVFKQEKPDVVIVQGDTISVLSGTLAAKRLGIKVAHHEAGLRSHDPSMIEETNRVTTDHLSDFLFAPTKEAVKNLVEEGYSSDRIFQTGNTVVDAVLYAKDLAEKKSQILDELELIKGKYVLITAHRSENVDKRTNLKDMIRGIESTAASYPDLTFVYSMHPRTKKMIDRFGLHMPQHVKIIEPVSFLDFLQLETHARLIMTDSGGLQEEACILQVPCVTMRLNTERPETVRLGINTLAGTHPDMIRAKVKEMMSKDNIVWENPFGDGKAGEHILEILQKEFTKEAQPEKVAELST